MLSLSRDHEHIQTKFHLIRSLRERQPSPCLLIPATDLASRFSGALHTGSSEHASLHTESDKHGSGYLCILGTGVENHQQPKQRLESR